jgi:nucleoside phosphorylase
VKKQDNTYRLLVIDDEPDDTKVLFLDSCLGDFLTRGELIIETTVALQNADYEHILSAYDGFLSDWILENQKHNGEDVLAEAHASAPEADLFLWTKSENLSSKARGLLRDVTMIRGYEPIPMLGKPLPRGNPGYFEAQISQVRGVIGRCVKRKLRALKSVIVNMEKNAVSLAHGEMDFSPRPNLSDRFILYLSYASAMGERRLEPDVWFHRTLASHGEYGTTVGSPNGEPRFHLPNGESLDALDWTAIWRHHTDKVRPFLSKQKKRFIEKLRLVEPPYRAEEAVVKSGCSLRLDVPPGLLLTGPQLEPIQTAEQFIRIRPLTPQSFLGTSQTALTARGETFASAFIDLATITLSIAPSEGWKMASKSAHIGRRRWDPPCTCVLLAIATRALELRDPEADIWLDRIQELLEQSRDMHPVLTMEQAIQVDYAEAHMDPKPESSRISCGSTPPPRISRPLRTTLLAERSHPIGALTAPREAVDLGIVIPMKEEFREFFSEARGHLEHEVDYQLGEHYYRFTKPGTDYRCIATVVGDQGDEASLLATERLIAKYSPTSVAMIGIAGGLSSDVRLGDVVLATSIDSYFTSGAAVPNQEGEGFVLHFGGKVFELDSVLCKTIAALEFTDPDQFERWRLSCAADLEGELGDTLATLQGRGLLPARSPTLHDGKLAAGPVVGKSEAFARQLLNRDRGLLAMEMESGGLARSVYSRTGPPPTIVLRGISDYADERKRYLDGFGCGALRRVAVRNALRFLWLLIDMAVVPR